MELAIKKMIVGSLLTIFTIVVSWLLITAIIQYRFERTTQILSETTTRSIQKMQEQTNLQIKQQAEARKQVEIERKLQQEHEAWQKAKALKEQSPQCKFWRLQKRDGTSDKADEKIKLYCAP